MITPYDKAIVGFLVPLIIGLLVHFGIPNADQMTQIVTDLITAILTLAAVYQTPNKGVTYAEPPPKP